MAKIKIGELLCSKGLLREEQLTVAMSQQSITGDMLGDTLMKLGFVSSKDMATALSEQAGMEFLDLDQMIVPEDALRLVSRDMAEACGFIPFKIDDGTVSIGVTDTTNIKAVDLVRKISGKPPKVYMVDLESFYSTLEKAYYFLEHPIHRKIEAAIVEIKAASTIPASGISSLTELLVMDGIRRNATDVHLNPAQDTVHVSYRIDGVLQHVYCLPKGVQAGVVSRIKILSELDIAEQRLPQDGSFSYKFLKNIYEMRVSVVPTIYGENTVLRILSGSRKLLSLSGLGFSNDETHKLRQIFSKPNGIIIVAGPTGSGKTTTLYAALREVDILHKNVLTVEDPVEYRLSMVKQTSIAEKAGYNFSLAGRSFMRQDPDVILIGEIRDEETASIAIRASITGHLVLTTLHTNDAITTIPRLLDLKVDKYLLSSALSAIVAQRLLRKICTGCKTSYKPDKDWLIEAGFSGVADKVDVAYRGEGCTMCNHMGYFGRIAVGEILMVTDEIKDMVYSGGSVNAIKEVASGNGMNSMRDNAVAKAMEGITSFEEVLRVMG